MERNAFEKFRRCIYSRPITSGDVILESHDVTYTGDKFVRKRLMMGITCNKYLLKIHDISTHVAESSFRCKVKEKNRENQRRSWRRKRKRRRRRRRWKSKRSEQKCLTSNFFTNKLEFMRKTSFYAEAGMLFHLLWFQAN